MQAFHTIFVTVGTTEFQELIDILITDEILTQLQGVQCKLLRIQHGTGKEINPIIIEQIEQKFSIKIECYNFKGNILSDITSSDLIISHAGAGSCIEVLTCKKPLIVVVNDKLMHNHQTELAQQLYIDGHLLYCTPKTLTVTLNDLNRKVSTLKPYEPGHNNLTNFVNHLDTIMGFE